MVARRRGRGRRGARPHPRAVARAGPGRRGRRRRARPVRAARRAAPRWSPASTSRTRRPPRRPAGHRRAAVAARGRLAGFAYEVQYLLDADEPAVERLRDARSPAWATRWSSSARPTAPGTSTCTSTTSARRSRPASRRAGRTGSRSPGSTTSRRRPPRPGARAVVVARRRRAWPRCSAARAPRWSARQPVHRRAARRDPRHRRGAGRGAAQRPRHRGGRRRGRARGATPTGMRVSVVPTRSPVQALAALAVRDPARRFDDDVIAMAEAAGACRYAEVCVAVRDALTMAGPCRPGDVLALVEGEVNLIGGDLVETCRGAARPDARRRRRAGHAAHRRRRAAGPSPTTLRGHLAVPLAVRRGAGATTAASRTTRCW